MYKKKDTIININCHKCQTENEVCIQRCENCNADLLPLRFYLEKVEVNDQLDLLQYLSEKMVALEEENDFLKYQMTLYQKRAYG